MHYISHNFYLNDILLKRLYLSKRSEEYPANLFKPIEIQNRPSL